MREITFENAEELTEEGLPFMILFHDPSDTESIKAYKSIVESQLIKEKRECLERNILQENFWTKNKIHSRKHQLLDRRWQTFRSSFASLGKISIGPAIDCHRLIPSHVSLRKLQGHVCSRKTEDIHRRPPQRQIAQVTFDSCHFTFAEFLSIVSFFQNREFHYGPDKNEETNEVVPQTPEEALKQAKTPTQPPESTFKKLAPSANRYTLLSRDEL